VDTVLRTLGPLDYYVVRLPDRDALPFEAVRETLSLVDAEIISVVDLVVIERSADSSVSTVEAGQLDPRHPLSVFAADVTPILTTADLDALAAPLPPATSVVVFVIEQLWAKPLRDTLEHWDCPVVSRGPIARLPAPTTSRPRTQLPWPRVLTDGIVRWQ
jgi:Family of unknown function (DUF6325)